SLTLTVAKPLIKPEKECLIFANRAADGRAELVLLQRFSSRSEVVGRVECIVAQEFPQRTMETVRPRASHNIGRRTQAVPEFWAGVVSQDSELSNGITWRLQNKPAVYAVEVVRAVDQEII